VVSRKLDRLRNSLLPRRRKKRRNQFSEIGNRARCSGDAIAHLLSSAAMNLQIIVVVVVIMLVRITLHGWCGQNHDRIEV